MTEAYREKDESIGLPEVNSLKLLLKAGYAPKKPV